MTTNIDLVWIDECIAWVWEQSEFDATGYAQNGSYIVPLSEIARVFGIEIEEIPDLTYGRASQFLFDELEIVWPVPAFQETKALAGFIHADPDATLILVKRGANVARHHVARRRFTVAHELGHFVLHFLPRWEKSFGDTTVLTEGIHAPLEEKQSDENQFSSDLSIQSSRQNYLQLEAEANAFAARLLMPEWAVRSLFEKWAPRLSERRSVLTRRFCEEFLVSAPAMRRRLDDLELGVADRDTSWF